MAGLKIEGDCTQINEKQLEFIKRAIEKRGYKNNTVVFEPLGKVGDNYMANVKRVKVEDGNNSLKMVVKLAPQSQAQRQFSHTEEMFRNEHILYTKILPKFTQIQKTYEISPQDKYRYPTCYGSSDDPLNEVLMLEDLSELNFTMLSRFENLSNTCIKSILRNFAQFHSLGFALKYKDPELFNECKSTLFDMMGNTEDMAESAALFNVMEMNILNLLESDYHKKVVKGIFQESLLNYGKITKMDVDSKYSIIQHGDAWTNNFLFKFNGDDLTQSVLIDYQAAKVANPVCDILFMLSICTDYQSRKEHFYEWLDYYHSELDKALSNYDLKSSIVYNRLLLDADLKRYGKYVFGHTMTMLEMIVLKSEEAAMIKKAMDNGGLESMTEYSGGASSKDPETVAAFKNKIVDLIESYRDFGLL